MISSKKRLKIYYWLPILPLIIHGCATNNQPKCLNGETHSVNELFYFGSVKPNGLVSEAEWKLFLTEVVTPLFPNGFTHWQGLGQWRGKHGRIVRENAFVLNIVRQDNNKDENAARAIANDYKLRFNQEAVLRVKSLVCVSY